MLAYNPCPGEKLIAAALAIDVDQGIKGEQVVAAMTRISSIRSAPGTILVDNGPKFISKALDRWAYENGITLDFSRPRKPMDNAFAASFTGRLGDECLNAHWFVIGGCPGQDRGMAADYNESRPHTALGWLTPAEYAASPGVIPAMQAENSHRARIRNQGNLRAGPS